MIDNHPFLGQFRRGKNDFEALAEANPTVSFVFTDRIFLNHRNPSRKSIEDGTTRSIEVESAFGLV